MPQLPPPFDFDKAIHDALATYYFPAMDDWSRSIVRPLAFKAFERSMGETRARRDAIRPLSQEESAAFAHHLALGAAMLTNWFAWAAETEDFDSLFADQDVWAPIADPEASERDLGTPDGRPIRYLGRIDQLIGDPDDEFWVVRHRLVRDEWTANDELINDHRILGECWALQVAYPQLIVAGTITNELRIEGQLVAKRPTEYVELDNRDMSGPRHTSMLCSPTPPPLAWAAASMTEFDHITDQHDNGLFRRTVVRRAPETMNRIGRQIAEEVEQMQLDDLSLEPTFASHCAECSFRRPCAVMEAGGDFQAVLDAGYEQVPDDIEAPRRPANQSKTVNLRWGGPHGVTVRLMRAWILEESPGRYRFGEIDTPEPGADDVRVRVVVSALNHMDLWVTTGQPRPELPHVPGCDVAGVIDAVGERTTGFAVGDEVVVNPAVAPLEMVVAHGDDAPMWPGFGIVGEQRWGGHAELIVVPGRNVVPRPAGRTWAECAAYPLATLTAWRMLRRSRLRAGETVLIVGIGGGVSTAALSLAVRMGATVYVTSRDEAKGRRAIELGAVEAFDSGSSEDWPVRAEVVVESVGPATWDRSVKALAPGGRLVVCGGTSGPKVEVSLPRLFFKQIEIIGSTMGGYGEFADVTRFMSQGLPVVVDQELPLASYPDALAQLASGAQLGKIVLRHDL